MFRSCIAAVLVAVVVLTLATGIVRAQNPTNGDDLIFRAIAGESFVIHRYTTTGIASTFTPPDGVIGVEYLIVGGGGGGGNLQNNSGTGAGAGGAGGLLKYVAGEANNSPLEPITVTTQEYPIMVGAGGDGATGHATDGSTGSDSTAFDLTALGGGGGGANNNPARQGQPGGSGGGGGALNAGTNTGGAGLQPGSASGGFGNQGGDGASVGSAGGGGGGGAGSAGQDGSTTKSGDGGDGIVSSITGTAVGYAGGGGGGATTGGSVPAGSGKHGGGDGASTGSGSSGGDGQVNTGGGGGGGAANANTASPGGSGGSGVVVVRYLLDDVTGWNDHGYYALPDLGMARNVLVEDGVVVQVGAGHEFSILSAGMLTVGNGASLAVQGTLTMQGTLNIDAGGNAAIDAGGRLVLNSTGAALAGELLIGGGAVVFNGNNQIADTASVTMTAGSLNWTDQRNNHTETFANLTATGGAFRPGTGSNWTITGAGEFTGGAGSTTNIAANSGSQLTFGSLTLTDLTSTTAATNNSFTIYGNNPALTTVSVGPGGLTLNNSRILMQWTSGAGNALILGGDVAATGTSTIQDTGSSAGSLRLNTTDDSVTRTFDVAGNTSHLRITANITDGAAGAAGAAGILKTGTGLLTLQGTNDYTGGTTVAEGVVSFRSHAALPASGQVNVAAGAGLALGVKADDIAFFSAADVDALFTNTFANVSMAEGSLVGIDTAAGEFTYDSNAPAVNRGLVKVGPGTLTLTGNNQHEGDTVVIAGTLRLDTTSGRAVPGSLIVSGGTVTFATNNQIDDDADVTMTAGQFSQRNWHRETLGSLTATGGDFRTGEDSRWTISGDAAFTGGSGMHVRVNSGTEITVRSLTLTELTSTDYSISSPNAFILFGNRSDVTAISVGAGGLALNNSRILMRTTTAGSAGAAVVLGGNVTATGTSAIQKAGDLDGYLWLNTTDQPVTRPFNVAGGGSLEIQAVITDGLTDDLDEDDKPIPAAAGSIVKTGPGTLTLAEANTYTGTTTVLAGTLEVTGSLAKNTSADVLVASAGTTFDGTEPNIIRRVANGAPLAGLGSQIIGEPRLAGFHTEAELLAGTNHSGGPLPVGMAWRMFGEGEAQGTAPYLRPVSDVLQLTGITETSPFVLQMSYDASLVTSATEGGLHLAWLDGTEWVNAVAGNSVTGDEAVARYWGSWYDFTSEHGTDLNALLGSWGVHTDGAAVWAVLNHNSEFGVLVPEPGNLVLLAFAVLGLLLGRRRRFRI